VSAIDLDRLLAKISPKAPSGEKDLEGDAKFVELQTKIEGTPARYDGKQELPAIGPNWREVRDAAVELLTRTHDLRVAMSFSRAMLHTAGLKGLSTGLELLGGLIERYWETLYPRLDLKDNNDPTERINILVALCEGEDIIGPLLRTYLCVSREVGNFSLRDIHIANGKINPTENDTKHGVEIINAAFKKSAVEDLQATRAAISASLHNLDTLTTVLNDKISESLKENKNDSSEIKKSDSYRAVDFEKLQEILKEMEAVLDEQLKGRVAPDSPTTDESPQIEESNNAQVGKSVFNQRSTPLDTINTRQEVIRALDNICTYYQNNEPGSPVPVLLKRARQLVEKNFFEIMQDLGLDSATQIKTLFSGAADDTS
jgi:type VI secretion system protein ImpA